VLEGKGIIALRKRLARQAMLILALFVLFSLAVYFLGVPIISWIYNVDLAPYASPLLFLSMTVISRAYQKFDTSACKIHRKLLE